MKSVELIDPCVMQRGLLMGVQTGYMVTPVMKRTGYTGRHTEYLRLGLIARRRHMLLIIWSKGLELLVGCYVSQVSMRLLPK